MSVSVLILTLDEEINIRACLESVRWSDDVVVLDSLSTDRTLNIAAECGARVVSRAFDNWSAHQNWAIANIAFKHPWVLYIDADERCEEALRDELRRRARADAPEAAFRVRRKDHFMGRWLKHAQLYPTWMVRAFRPGKIRYERLVNPIAHVEGATGELSAHILHYPFSHGIHHWVARHNRYSDFEAVEKRRLDGTAVPLKGLWSSEPQTRRQALKAVFFRLPARPAIKFIYYYIGRRGFLDGRSGLTYSVLLSIYEYLIDVKYREMLRQERGLPR